MRDPRIVRLLPGSSLRYLLLRWRRDRAAWYVEELRDELSEIDDLADALKRVSRACAWPRPALSNRHELRRLRRGPLPFGLDVVVRPPKGEVH